MMRSTNPAIDPTYIARNATKVRVAGKVWDAWPWTDGSAYVIWRRGGEQDSLSIEQYDRARARYLNR